MVNHDKIIKIVFKIQIILLIFFFTLKLLFNLWYPIILENERLLAFSNLLDANIVIRNIIYSGFYLFNIYMITLILNMKKKFSLKISILILISFTLIFILKIYNNNLAMILELLLFILFSIRNLKHIKYMLLMLLIIMSFQLTLLFVRGIEELLKDIPSMIAILLQIDYYIFLTTIYIGGCHMSLLGAFFFGKTSVEVRANIERELLKEEPNQDILNKMYKAFYEISIDEISKNEE